MGICVERLADLLTDWLISDAFYLSMEINVSVCAELK